MQQISKEHEVWLLTSDEFEREILSHLVPGIHATFIPCFKVWEKLRNLAIPGLDWLYYYWWQWKAYRLGRKLHQSHKFDLVHHITFASWRVPSFLCLLDVPFIWGPVGGGENLPRPFWSELGPKGRIHETIRQLFQAVSRWDPFVRLTAAKASSILVGNRDTKEILPRKAAAKTHRMSNAGISASDFLLTASASQTTTDQFQVLFAGMLEPRKGIPLLLRGFAAFASARSQCRLAIAGDGPELPRLKSQANELGIASKLEFTGWLEREELLRRMQTAHVFVFPSLRDSAGIVLLEAMLAERPVICLNLGGPGEIVAEDCGIKINAQTPKQAAQAIGEALLLLAADPELRRRLGAASRQRVLEHFEWNRKGAAMLSLYEQVLHKTAGRPMENFLQ